MRIIAFVNQKGGVGKTTLSLNLASILADNGSKVLIIDNDSQANITNTFLDEEPENTLYNVILHEEKLENIIHKTNIENLDIAVNSLASSDINLLLSTEIAREMKLKNAIENANIDYDYVFIDCNPALDLNLINALVATEEVVIPIDTSAYSLTGLKNLVAFIDKVKVLNKKLDIKGFVLNNIDRRTSLYKDIEEAINELYPGMLLSQGISLNSIFSKMQFAKETIIANKSNKAYAELNNLLLEVK